MVVLSIIAIPLVGSCGGDTRGLAACLHDMAERKFGPLDAGPGTAPVVATDVAPVAVAISEAATASVSEPPNETPLAAPADTGEQRVAVGPGSSPPEPAAAESSASAQGGPLLAPMPGAGEAERQDVALADAVEPILPPAPEAAPPALVPEAPVVASEQYSAAANAELPPEPPAPTLAAPVVVPPTIDAIELDGDESYISGSGPAGSTIRLYTNGDLVGESPVEEGRWLVEAGDILSVPRRELRIEAIEPGTGRVLGRAAITVEIEPPPPGDAPEPPPEPAPEPEGSIMPVVPPLPAPPSLASVPDAADAAPESPAVAPVPQDQSPDEPAQVGRVAAAPQPAPAETAATGNRSAPPAERSGLDARASSGPLPPIDAIVPRAESASVQILPVPSDPAQGGDASVVELPRPGAPALIAEFQRPPAPSTGSATIVKLIPFGDPLEGRFTGGKAIIRHGDTLWSIAHRYYGSGIHYRTIFKANRDLIARPSKIFPGQVFDLPLVTEE